MSADRKNTAFYGEKLALVLNDDTVEPDVNDINLGNFLYMLSDNHSSAEKIDMIRECIDNKPDGIYVYMDQLQEVNGQAYPFYKYELGSKVKEDRAKGVSHVSDENLAPPETKRRRL